jgi:hypothetical protein
MPAKILVVDDEPDLESDTPGKAGGLMRGAAAKAVGP